MADQRKTERDEPQRPSADEEHVRGIADAEDDFDEDDEDFDEEEADEDETA